MSWYTEKKVLIGGFFVAIAIVLGLSILALMNYKRLRNVNYTVAKTIRLVNELSAIDGTLENAVISERGYIITGDTGYRTQYQQAVDSLDKNFTDLSATLRGESARQEFVDSLEQLVEQNLDLLDNRMRLRRTEGVEAVTKVIRLSGIEQILYDAEEAITVYNFQEQARLANEIDVLQRYSGRTIIVYFVGVILGIVLLSVIYYLLHQQIRLRQQVAEEMQRHQHRLNEAERIAHLGNWEWDPAARRLNLSEEVYRILGIGPEDFDGSLSRFLEFIYSGDRERVMAVFRRALETGDAYSQDYRIVRRDGKERIVHNQGEVTSYQDRTAQRMLGTIQDISRRKRDETAIREREELLRELVKSVPIIIFALDLDGNITFIDGKGLHSLGITPEGVVGSSIYEVSDRYPALRTNVKRALRGEEFTVVLSDEDVYFETRCTPLRDDDGEVTSILGVSADITERKLAEEALKRAHERLEDRVQKRTRELKQANKALQDEIEHRTQVVKELENSLHEKEVLLKEIHHRVKNNLQVISSLLFLQSRKHEDSVVSTIITESQNRVRTMALIHEKLYQSQDLSNIDFGNYLRELVHYLKNTYHVSAPIEVAFDVHPMSLGLNKAIPAGLIVNELVSNAFQHAFPEGRAGHIRIRFSPLEEDLASLKVEDDGIGFPEQFDIRRVTSLGLQLVQNLAEQLNGTLELTHGSHTAIAIRFHRK